MKKYSFDEKISRRNTGCIKYDFSPAKEDPEVIPLWVADMDFPVLPEITQALQERAAHPVYGYTFATDAYFQAVMDWMQRRHDWTIERDWIVPIAGVVPALKQCVQAYTEPGQEILVFKPVYYPFDEAILSNGRQLVECPLVYDPQTGVYTIDFEALEDVLDSHDVKMMIFCSPHNPVSRVWSQEELQKVAEAARKHNVMVISDEIHMDFAHESTHIPFLKAAEELKDDLVICTAPSKTFNIAGLNTSNLIIPSEERRNQLAAVRKASGSESPNLFGLAACQAAYEHGDQWVDEMNEYLVDNARYVTDWVQEHLPMVKVTPLEGTYLLWMDFRAIEPDPQKLQQLMLEKARIWLDEGYIFGHGGEGFERINLACPRDTLQQALERMEKTFREEGKI